MHLKSNFKSFIFVYFLGFSLDSHCLKSQNSLSSSSTNNDLNSSSTNSISSSSNSIQHHNPHFQFQNQKYLSPPISLNIQQPNYNINADFSLTANAPSNELGKWETKRWTNKSRLHTYIFQHFYFTLCLFYFSIVDLFISSFYLVYIKVISISTQ